MKRYLYLAAGTFLMAAAYKSIYQSVGMVTGGFSGIGVIVNRVTGGVWAGGVPLWLTNVTLNVPLFIAAFYIEGKEFIKNTVTGAVLLTLYLAVLPAVPVDAADYLLAAVYGGAACGAGIGLVLKSGFTTGGTDMLGVLLHRFFRQYALASIIQVLDMAVIIAGESINAIASAMQFCASSNVFAATLPSASITQKSTLDIAFNPSTVVCKI